MRLVVCVPLQTFRVWPFISGVTSKRNEVDSYFLFPMHDILLTMYTWNCEVKSIRYIFLLFCFFFVRSFVCIAQYIVEQCNNDWKHVSMYLLPLKITVVNLYCVISPLEFLPLILPMFLFLMSRSTVRSTTRLLPFSLCKVQTAAEKSAY